MTPGLLILSIIILDILDCNRFFNNISECKTFEYQSRDKWIDLFTYMYAIALFHQFYDLVLLQLLYVAIIIRYLGVFLFTLRNNSRFLQLFPDLINGLLISQWLWKTMSGNPETFWPFIISGILFKILYEQWHHKRQYVS